MRSNFMPAGASESIPPAQTSFKSLLAQKKAILGALLALLGLVIAFFFMVLSRSDLEHVEHPTFGLINTPSGVQLRIRPGVDQPRELVLRSGSVVDILGETRRPYSAGKDGEGPWSLIRSTNGSQGYVFSRFVKRIPPDIAQRQRVQDRSKFESLIRDLSKDHISIAVLKVFPNHTVGNIAIISPLTPDGSGNFSMEGVAHLVGGLIGLDKRLVKVRVLLGLELDPNLLSGSIVHVQSVEIDQHEQVDGIKIDQAFDLLTKIIP